jgi:glycosyltransferase involved in cell wall biosynthesis
MRDKLYVGVLATHPIQYYVPWYRALAQVIDLRVFYCHRQTPQGQAAAGFGVPFEWDIPLLSGYSHQFLHNRARLPDVSSFFGCHTPQIRDVIRRERFDAFIVHGWATRSFWQAITACWRTGTPVLVRGDSQLSTSRPPLWRLAKYPLYRFFIPRFDAYLVVGQRARDYLLHYGADAQRMFFASHAVDNDFFAGRADMLRPERDRLRAAWGIPSTATVFLLAGKFIPKKRPQDFVRAVAVASQHHVGVWGLMVGDGPLRPSLEEAAKSNGWPLRFAGFVNQSEMPKAYAASDALVVTSSSETWGLVVNEAMASGLTAVVSDQVGCAPDLVRPFETGEVFTCGSVAELARVLASLASNPAHLSNMKAQAGRLIKKYALEQTVEGTLAALRAVARPGHRLTAVGCL